MRIALIQSPVWGTYDPPIAIAQLSSCLKKEGHSVRVFDLNIELYLNRTGTYKDMWAWEQSDFWYDPFRVRRFFDDNQESVNKYIDLILGDEPQIVCFSVATSSRIASLEFARKIKEKNKNAVVIFGGTLFFERRWSNDILNEGQVDIVVYGEGENTLSELTKLLETKKPLDSCYGIAFKSNGIIKQSLPRSVIANLDDLPFLDFSGLPLMNYDDPGHIPFLASRGCVQRCVFCSSRAFWPGYRRMSGKRIFEEIAFHKRQNNRLGHIDFLDLMFNGDIRELNSFCELMNKSQIKGDISWVANAIIRPEMTPELLQKMKESGCKHLIYGIESGSKRVLDLMKKVFSVSDADAVIRATHEAGIVVTANFMFGFPGEQESDFSETLDFIRRNAEYLDRVYPSRTFCALEEFSYLQGHLEEFGIKPNPPNHLYWESQDNMNTYPQRLRRCEEFCRLASSLGIEVGCGVQTDVDLDKWFNMGHYYEHKKDFNSALGCWLNYYEADPGNKVISEKIIAYSNDAGRYQLDPQIGQEVLNRLNKAALSIRSRKAHGIMLEKRLDKVGREKSKAILKSEQRDNSRLNTEEFNRRKFNLRSTPKAFFLQLSGPCNSSCVFCSRGRDYEMFDLEVYRKRFEDKLSVPLIRAEQIIFTGSGEFLLLPNPKEILDYFDAIFPHVSKMFSTNGSGLTPEICEKISSSSSKYTIHVSLHASNNKLHEVITRSSNFHKILGQLKYLLELRKRTGNPAVHLIFVATTLNIQDLPNFVRLAANLGVDKVICYYNYIYVPAQKYLSCFFKQEFTNQMLDEAGDLSGRLNIKIDLPPKFSQKEYPNLDICREAWDQVMFNLRGDVLPCDASEDCGENLKNVEFADVWNSRYYHQLRQSLVNRSNSCFKYCLRANPQAVNDFCSHVIRRGRRDSEIDILWGDNF